MSEEIKELHIKTYDEWLKYYKNATKEQIIEDLTRDVQYFADAVKDIKDLQQKVEQLEKENKILKENAEHNDKVVDKVNWENMLLKRKNKEIDRLNNIINELEKELREGSFDVYFCSTNTQKTFKSNEIIIKSLILDKLKELKDSD